MNKLLKIVLNVLLVAGVIISFGWAYLLFITDCSWGHAGDLPRCTVFSEELFPGNSFFWVFLVVVPGLLIAAFLVLNRRFIRK